jgi:hypothetical protein
MAIETMLKHPDFSCYLKKHCGKLNINSLRELAVKLNPKVDSDWLPPKKLLAIFGPKFGEACVFQYQPLPGDPPKVKLIARSNLGDFEQVLKLAEKNNNRRICYSFICGCGDKVKNLFLDCDSDKYVCVSCLAGALTFVSVKTKQLQRSQQLVPAY